MLVRSVDPTWLSCAYLAAAESGDAVAIDTGAPLEPLLDAIVTHRLTLRAILCTHRHPDHVSGNEALASATGAPVHALRGEAEHVPLASPVEDGAVLAWEGIEARVVALPGHTAHQCGYLVPGIGLFTGDCLFRGSLGGNVGPAASGFAEVRRAVLRILALPDDTAIHPGHAEPTTVGRERTENPFVRVMTGRDPEGDGLCETLGRSARLVVLARDYDGGTKAWVRFEDGTDAIVPGSRVRVILRPPTRS